MSVRLLRFMELYTTIEIKAQWGRNNRETITKLFECDSEGSKLFANSFNSYVYAHDH